VNLSDAQLDRYARHIVLREIGGEGQRRLLDSTVAVIGAGGIGSPLIQYLAAAGVGALRIIDDDVVDLSNLQRQTLFGTSDQGQAKTERARAAVEALNPDIAVEAVGLRIDADNAAKLLAGADAVVDGSDNFATRLAVSDATTALRVPSSLHRSRSSKGSLRSIAAGRRTSPAIAAWSATIRACPSRAAPNRACSARWPA
jgi:adenylyltransferase/sulfurtransferase